jgi:hypothetical protein
MKREIASSNPGPPTIPKRRRGRSSGKRAVSVNIPDPHGTYGHYVNARCRCERCREAQRDYYLAHRDRIIAQASAWRVAHKNSP